MTDCISILAQSKRCTKCLIVKPLAEFYRHPHTHDRRQGHCKDCSAAIKKEAQSSNPDRCLAMRKAYNQRVREKNLALGEATIESKLCTKCSEIKPASEFGKNICSGDRLQSWCRKCLTEDRRRWRATNPGRDLAVGRAYRDRKIRKNLGLGDLAGLTKTCLVCHEVKLLDEFHLSASGEFGRTSVCINCRCQYAHEWRKRPDVQEKEKLARRRFVETGQSRRCAMERRKTLRGYLQALRATRRTISLDRLLELYSSQCGRCAITGEPMTTIVGQDRIVPSNISVDRIDPKLGYVNSNIQLVSCHANVAKWTLTMEELVQFCRKVVRKHGDAYPDTSDATR
jgi:hypothetical protein